jgi:beta-fructofuranosidase
MANTVSSRSGTQTRGFDRFADGRPVGDVIPFFDGGLHHLFILTPPAGTLHFPERLHTTWRHITSPDMVDWTELPPAIDPGPAGAADGAGIWTGSAIRAGETLHIFYTGFANPQQSVCHATSTDDGLTWLKDPANPLSLPDPSRFESTDWRDPFVFFNEDDGRYWMLVTCRASGVNAPTRGMIVSATSDDLVTWSEPEVFYRTLLTHALECPEIFRLGDKWVLGYSRFTDRRGTVYRVSDSLSGPWRTFGEDGPDAANWYAAKGLSDADGRRIAYGWVPDHDPAPTQPANPWLWAGTLGLPRELILRGDREIGMRLPAEVAAQFGDDLDFETTASDGAWQDDDGQMSVDAPGDVAIRTFQLAEPTTRSVLSATFDDLSDVYQVGVVVHTGEMLDRGIGVFYYPRTSSIRMVDMTAPAGKVTAEYETMFGQYAPIAVHDLPGPLGGPVEFTVVVRGDVVEAFVGDVCALTVRTHGEASTHAAIVVVDGSCSIGSLRWRAFD